MCIIYNVYIFLMVNLTYFLYMPHIEGLVDVLVQLMEKNGTDSHYEPVSCKE